jgi:hypothetical protein
MTRADWNRLTKAAGVSQRTIERWESSARGGVSLERRSGSGRPSVLTAQVVAELHKLGDECEWLGTNEFYAVALAEKGFAVSTSAVQRYIALAGWKTGTASTVPVLSAKDCDRRVVFCTDMLQRRGSRVVHLHGDEKVFTAEGMARQRAPSHVSLHRPGKTSQYKNKIMVWSVVGCPMPEYDFDGRLELVLIGRLHVAAVASKNHKKGDIYVKAGDETVDAAYFYNLILTQTAPRIREQFADAEQVHLQIDNAPGHVGKHNFTEIERAREPARRDSRSSRIVYQPANSPDLNLNDLGVFYSMQKMYRVVRTRAKLKAAARQIASAPFDGGVGTRGQRAAAAVGARRSAPAMRRDATPSPTPKPSLPIGCAGFHNNESDADMPCIACRRPATCRLTAAMAVGFAAMQTAVGGTKPACSSVAPKGPCRQGLLKWVCASAPWDRRQRWAASMASTRTTRSRTTRRGTACSTSTCRSATAPTITRRCGARCARHGLRCVLQMLEKLWGTLQKIYPLVVESKGRQSV